MPSRRHVWTDFEKHALLCLMCRGIHITGFIECESPVTFGKKRRRSKKKIDPQKAYMDVATALNQTVHSRDYGGDIPVKDVTAMIQHILIEKKGSMAVIERQGSGRITRAMKRVFERGISFKGDVREWNDGRKRREEELRLNRETGSLRNFNGDIVTPQAQHVEKQVPEDTTTTATPSAAQSQALGDGWGIFGGNVMTASPSTQSQGFDDDWGFGDNTLTIDSSAPVQNQIFDNTTLELGSAASRMMTSAMAQIQTFDNGQGRFGGVDLTQKTQNPAQSQDPDDGWGGGATTTPATNESRYCKWDTATSSTPDQPLPSTERPIPKPKPIPSQDGWGPPPASLNTNRTGSGNFSQESDPSSRSTSLTYRRNERSMAPSPDLPDPWGGVDSNLSDLKECNAHHPRNESSSEDRSKTSEVWSSTTASTTASTPVAETTDSDTALKSGINPERLAMLAQAIEDTEMHMAHESVNLIKDLKAKDKNTEQNPNYTGLSFNRMEMIHGNGDPDSILQGKSEGGGGEAMDED